MSTNKKGNFSSLSPSKFRLTIRKDIMQNKLDVYVLEPNLELRKPLAQLFPLSKYLVKFFPKHEEILNECEMKIPHLVILNLDIKSLNYSEEIARLVHVIPKETFILGLSNKANSKANTELSKLGLQEIWDIPIAGLKIKPRIDDITHTKIQPIVVNLSDPLTLSVNLKGEILALGETEFIAKFPVKFSFGDKINVKSNFLNDLFQSEKKSFVITENDHGVITQEQVTVSVLGLRNDDLKNIRAKIINWEKL